MTFTFFSHAPDSPTSGTSTYAQAILRFNYQYYLTGLVEMNYAPGCQVLALVSDGAPAGCYHVTNDVCRSIQPEQIEAIWPEGEAPIRSIMLPREAVRIVRAILEWHPPIQTLTLENITAQDFLASTQDLPSPGIIHFNSHRAGGYVPVHQGAAMAAETVFSTPNGVEAGAHVYRNMLASLDSPCTVRVYPARPGTETYQQQALRFSLVHWGSAIFTRYQQLVGRGMLANLDSDLNACMRARSCHIQVGGDSISDSCVFPSVGAAAAAYQALLSSASEHMANVLGPNLTPTIFAETFQKLAPQEQQALVENSLAPAVIVRR